MRPIKFIVEKTRSGYSAYAVDKRYPLTTVGVTMEELKANMLDAVNSFMEFNELPEVGAGAIAIQIDMKQIFTYYKEINAKAIGKRAGINETLLSQYINGKKIPSEKQQMKILNSIHALGKELQALEFA